MFLIHKHLKVGRQTHWYLTLICIFAQICVCTYTKFVTTELTCITLPKMWRYDGMLRNIVGCLFSY